MQLVSIPLVMVLPSWMRWKEFYLFVYLNMRRYVADEYVFNEEKENMMNESQMRKTASRKDLHKKTQNFKDYQKGDKFPYTLRLSDYEGRCISCCKFLKGDVFEGESTTFCKGCKYSQS